MFRLHELLPMQQTNRNHSNNQVKEPLRWSKLKTDNVIFAGNKKKTSNVKQTWIKDN